MKLPLVELGFDLCVYVCVHLCVHVCVFIPFLLLLLFHYFYAV